jgi:hypothetical protein
VQLAFKHKVKVSFFSESEIRFSNLPIYQKNIPKNYPELEIPAHISKQLIQISSSG